MAKQVKQEDKNGADETQRGAPGVDLGKTTKTGVDMAAPVATKIESKKDEKKAGRSGTKTAEYKEKAKILFEQYPKANVFYFTSDGLAFFEETDAKNHANGLEKKGVLSIENEIHN